MQQLVEETWRVFVDCTRGLPPQGAVGRPPRSWLKSIRPDLAHELATLADLPDTAETRTQVLKLCRTPEHPVLRGYVHVMAWGVQGAGPGIRHAKSALDDRGRIIVALDKLRAGGMARDACYDLFTTPPVRGLGPSFFTKLLYFFSGDDHCYIMDQWTAKSVNLLFGSAVVKLAGGAPSNANTGADYAAYCACIDLLAQRYASEISAPCSGAQIEEKLFCNGGREPGPWRSYVRTDWRSVDAQGRSAKWPMAIRGASRPANE